MKVYLLTHGATILGAVAAFLVAVRFSGSKRSSQATLAWLLALVFVPVVSVPLFLLLGRRKFPSRSKVARQGASEGMGQPWSREDASSLAGVLRQSGAPPPRRDNSFELITTGEAAYARTLDLIAGSARTIDLTMFILKDDATGRGIVSALVERAAHGVRVRVILDAVGSAGARRWATTTLATAGAEVREFMPLIHSPIRGRTNLRSHRKLAIFDGRHVLCGGMNLADEYMGPTPSPGRWRDIVAIATGEVARDAGTLFDSDWSYCGGSTSPPPAPAVTPAPQTKGGEERVQIVASGPDQLTDTFYDLFLCGIMSARDRVVLVTPYYVPDDALQHALVLAARRGVRTELVVPSVSNHRVADVARRDLLRELTAGGAFVHYYPHGMVHAKTMVIDDSFAYVGSPNFDMRSLFLNYENALCVYSLGAVSSLRAFADGIISQCVSHGPPARRRALIEQIARLVAPEL
jgi:cardiolipin synthase